MFSLVVGLVSTVLSARNVVCHAFFSLFSIKIMASSNKNSTNIHDITIGKYERKLSQCPDDTSRILADTESVKNIVDILKHLSKLSGLESHTDNSILL